MHPDEWWWFYESKIDPDKLVSPADKWEALWQMLD